MRLLFPLPLWERVPEGRERGYPTAFRKFPIHMHMQCGEHSRMRQSLLPFAKDLRFASTEAEARLWRHFRATRLRGFKFKRQQPIGDYIVDFVCFERKLIVEVDGSQHLDAVGRDGARTAWLESQGFAVVRFWNDAVLRDTDCVLEEVLRMLDRG